MTFHDSTNQPRFTNEVINVHIIIWSRQIVQLIIIDMKLIRTQLIYSMHCKYNITTSLIFVEKCLDLNRPKYDT